MKSFGIGFAIGASPAPIVTSVFRSDSVNISQIADYFSLAAKEKKDIWPAQTGLPNVRATLCIPSIFWPAQGPFLKRGFAALEKAAIQVLLSPENEKYGQRHLDS